MKLGGTIFKKNFWTHGSGVDAPRALVNPFREWRSILVVSLIASVSLFTYIGLSFYRQYTDDNMPEINEESIPRYREEEAMSLIRFYDGKEEIFTKLKADTVIVNIPDEVSTPKPEVVPPQTLDAEVVAGQ